MAASAYSPSSSQVTIPTPGRSILKRAPPPQPSFFSKIKTYLPNQAPVNLPEPVDLVKPLRKAHFILPQISVIYPISSVNPPSTPTIKEEKLAIEVKEAERRKRVVRGNSCEPGSTETEHWWSLDKVESFYRECCLSREEQPDPVISAAFKSASNNNPRAVDISGAQLTVVSSEILSDVLNIDWGLRKLILKECNLDELTLKPILHALLIPGGLSFLSVASNRHLKPPAFRLLGAYMLKTEDLQFLDVSQNVMEKKSIEYIIAALKEAPRPCLVSLRLDDCSIRPAALETLARSVRTSSLRNISLRHNRISAAGAVAIAIMIRDYPDVVPQSAATGSPGPTQGGYFPPASPTPSITSLPGSIPVNNSPASSVVSLGRAQSVIAPPPRHPGISRTQTTYTPYVPRVRRGATTPLPNPLSPTGQQVPIITSSSQGGVTTMTRPDQSPAALALAQGPSAALLDKVRALDALPRLGALRTLDLKGNDLKSGITYVAQVLKRNRTLKVLNLSENKLDVQCLVSIAEALKYNQCLETLDLSKNPCCGPALEGIQSLRTAFTLNNALKRLFLSSTGMNSDGAIALAEFLPESMSLLHLDLTMNNLDIAGVMALSSGLKSNHVMRCLDLNIPPGDDEFAKMCRDILSSCVRNTEEAERNTRIPNGSAEPSSGRGIGKGVWGMIEESELAKSIKKDDNRSGDIYTRAKASLDELMAFESGNVKTVSKLDYEETLAVAHSVVSELAATVDQSASADILEPILLLIDSLHTAIAQAHPGPSRSNSHVSGLGIVIPSTIVDDPHYMDESPINEETSQLTPRVDKGKSRADPEPEVVEKVLSPNTSSESDDDEAFQDAEDGQGPKSPSQNDISKIWVEEEGEVFRKGNVLLSQEELETDHDSDALRKELLEAMVERPPPRGVNDDFGENREFNIGSLESPPVSIESSGKPPPRPYISRRKSSADSVTSPQATSPASESRAIMTSPSLLSTAET